MIFSTYWENEKTSDIEIDDNRNVTYRYYTDNVARAPYMFENPTYEQIEEFVKSRCVNEKRENLKEYLNDIGLTEYNPWRIIEITHGVMWEDLLWIKFPGENIKWEDVKIRD